MKNNFTFALSFFLCTYINNAYSAPSRLFDWLWTTPTEIHSATDDNNFYTEKEYLNWQETKNYTTKKFKQFQKSARKYVPDHVLDSLKKDILISIKKSSANSLYKKDLVMQYIFGAILDFIETASTKYAYKKLQNNIQAKKIAESMRNNALAKISKNPDLNLGELAPFIGVSLIKAVDEYQQ